MTPLDVIAREVRGLNDVIANATAELKAPGKTAHELDMLKAARGLFIDRRDALQDAGRKLAGLLDAVVDEREARRTQPNEVWRDFDIALVKAVEECRPKLKLEVVS